MIELKLRFWTNNIAEDEGSVRPKHARSAGIVRIASNKSHGIVSGESVKFHSLLDIGRAVEQCLIDHEIVLHPSRKMRKYTA